VLVISLSRPVTVYIDSERPKLFIKQTYIGLAEYPSGYSVIFCITLDEAMLSSHYVIELILSAWMMDMLSVKHEMVEGLSN